MALKDARQCEAVSKRTGERCKNPAVTGRRVCRIHGGKTPAGIASPHFRTGRYSRYLPARLAARYQEAKEDGDLLALEEEIALIDARLADLLGRVDSGESGQAWKLASAAYKSMEETLRQGDNVEYAQAIKELGQIIGRGLADYGAWEEVGRMVEQRRRLVESERKRMVELQQVISVERLILLVSAIADSVRRNVGDQRALSAIQTDIERLLSSGS